MNLKEIFEKINKKAKKKEELLAQIQKDTSYKKVQAETQLRELNRKNYPSEMSGFWDSAKNGTRRINKQTSELSKDKLIVLAKSLGIDVNTKMFKKDILDLINQKKGE